MCGVHVHFKAKCDDDEELNSGRLIMHIAPGPREPDNPNKKPCKMNLVKHHRAIESNFTLSISIISINKKW